METLREAYNTLRRLVPEYYPPFEEEVTDLDQMQILLLDINQYVQRTEARKIGTAPEGFWYMATLTSKPSDSVESLIENHKRIMDKYDDVIVHAVHEKSNIHHIHYILNLKTYHNNMARDVTRLTGRIFQVEKRANTLKKWRGMCKYLLKREYSNGKEDTTVAILKDGIGYDETKSYYIK